MRRFLMVAMLPIALALTACGSDVDREYVDAEVSSLEEDTSSLEDGFRDLEVQVAPLPEQIDVLETRLLSARRNEEELSQRLEQQRLALADYESRTNGIINRLRSDLESMGEDIATLEEELRQHVEDRSRFYYDNVINDLCDVFPDDIRDSVCERDPGGTWWRLRQ